MNKKYFTPMPLQQKNKENNDYWDGRHGVNILYRFRVLFYTGAVVSVLLVTALGVISYVAIGQQQACCLSELPSFQRFEYIKAIIAAGTVIVLGIVAFLVYLVLNELNGRFMAYQREHELNQMKSKFITLASHEFRTPLSTILLGAALIEKYADREDFGKISKHSRKIKQVVHGLEGILDDFLSLDKLDAGRIVVNYSSFDLDALCRETLKEAAHAAAPAQILSYEPVGTVSNVTLDAGLIKSALTHLLSNAVKYAGEEAQIQLMAHVSTGRIDISVTDNGVGISKKDQEQLTSTFYRVSESGAIPGTGLGLYLVKSYVELMGGELHFHSIPGSETCFKMVFDTPQTSF